MYKKIVVGYDDSGRSLRAVEEAANLASSLGASLHLVNAVDADAAPDGVDLGEKRLADVAENYADLEVTVKSASGPPASVLVSEAERVGADLIIVGNRNVQDVTRILGNVAESVAHNAKCAVLIANTQ